MTRNNGGAGSTRAQLLSPADVGDLNRSRVLQTLWDHGPQSRADLARLAGVTRGTIGNIVHALLEAELLEEGEARAGHVGKPAVPLWFTPHAALTPVVTIDASGVEAGLVNARGEVLAQADAPLQASTATAETTRAAIVESPRTVAAAATHDMIGVGVALPGVYDPVNRVVLGSTPVPALVGDWLPTAVEEALGLPTVIENDSCIQALGERWFGEGRGRGTFASLQTGHGLGVGMVIDNRLYRGSNRRAAEFGHVCVVMDGERCVCGLRGCWESIATLRWLRRTAAEMGLDDAERLTAARLTEMADDDRRADELLATYADHLAVGIANLQQVFAPEVVILHGDAAGGGEPLRARIEECTRARVFEGNAGDVDVRISELGIGAGLVGAAALVFATHFSLTA